ncbi:universal stress protein UspA [Pseudomonas oryzihabitans]|nr:universal stress protein UspA [Pseudomonas psychrotolerans]KTT32865.1 universal stress protein UspA [Pseudomonas psychrotolerans]
MASLLACIDGSPHAESVCDHTAWLSRRLDAPVTLLHVQESAASGKKVANGAPVFVEDDEGAGMAKALLLNARQRLLQQGLTLPTQILRRPEGLVDTLKMLEADTRLLVIGKRGERSGDSGIGSQLEDVVRAVHRPILVCSGPFKQPRQFTIAYDGREATHQGVLALARSPLLAGMSGTLLRVGEDDPTLRKRLEDLALLLRSAGCRVDTTVAHGDVERIVPRHLDERRADLLIMGAYSHSSVWRFLRGSRTTQLLHKTEVPLLLLR